MVSAADTEKQSRPIDNVGLAVVLSARFANELEALTVPPAVPALFRQ